MKPENFEITSGYCGQFGAQYETTTEKTLSDAIQKAMIFNNLPVSEIEKQLAEGKSVKYQESPNYFYDHSHGIIRMKKQFKPVEMVKCDCGCMCPKSLVMSASMGTSCSNCYDEMSG